MICGSGIGISLAANKCKGAKACLCFDSKMSETARLMGVNIISMGERVVGKNVNNISFICNSLVKKLLMDFCKRKVVKIWNLKNIFKYLKRNTYRTEKKNNILKTTSINLILY